MKETVLDASQSIGAGIEIESLFVTPVGKLLLPNADELNPVLEEAILKREKQASGMARTNIGGWHSELDLMSWREVMESGFRNIVKDACYKFIGLQSGASQFSGRLDLTAWANVNRKGSYNRRHNHTGSLWSGVYYVRAGEYSDEDDDVAGLLCLDDPRGSINMYKHPGKPTMGANMHIRPRDGLMVVFPSWLYHSVLPFQSDTTRISIAFNCRFSHFKDMSNQ